MANDGALDSSVATISISVTPVNDAPIATGDSYEVADGGILSVVAPGVLTNDTDAEGDTLTAKVVTAVKHGILIVGSDGAFIYINDGSETTGDSFTYKANDGGPGLRRCDGHHEGDSSEQATGGH